MCAVRSAKPSTPVLLRPRPESRSTALAAAAADAACTALARLTRLSKRENFMRVGRLDRDVDVRRDSAVSAPAAVTTVTARAAVAAAATRNGAAQGTPAAPAVSAASAVPSRPPVTAAPTVPGLREDRQDASRSRNLSESQLGELTHASGAPARAVLPRPAGRGRAARGACFGRFVHDQRAEHPRPDFEVESVPPVGTVRAVRAVERPRTCVNREWSGEDAYVEIVRARHYVLGGWPVPDEPLADE